MFRVYEWGEADAAPPKYTKYSNQPNPEPETQFELEKTPPYTKEQLNEMYSAK